MTVSYDGMAKVDNHMLPCIISGTQTPSTTEQNIEVLIRAQQQKQSPSHW